MVSIFLDEQDVNLSGINYSENFKICFFFLVLITLKSDVPLSLSWFYLLQWKPFENEKRSSFHLTSSFRSEDTEAVVQRCSVRKSVLRNFVKFTAKHLCQSPFFNKVFIKKEALVQVFSCEFCEISKNTFFAGLLWTTASEDI